MAQSQYDVIVIGSGPAGYVAAIHAAQCGASVAVIEKDAAFGGTCLHRGCIPTKALLQSAHLFEKMQNASKWGISASDVAVDYAKVSKFKQRIVKTNAGGVKFLFKKNKVTTVRGWGELAGKNRVRVKQDDGSQETLFASKGIILATGSGCNHLPFIEMDHKRTIDSDDILELTEIPKSLIVLGSGAVGTEFASIFHRFGCDVTLVELLPRVLPLEDEEISKAFEKAITRQGIKVMTSTRVEAVKLKKGGIVATAVDESGGKLKLEAEKILVATGRKPLTAGVGLENTRAVVDERGFVDVDEYMRSAEPGLYAIGDIVPTAMLAHLGSHEGMLAVDHLLGRHATPINYERVPSCTYCDPEVGSVGLTEEEARKRGYDVKVGTFPFTANGKAKILGEPEGFVKIVGESKYDEVLGVHIMGPKATELITESVVALNLETTAAELAHSIHPHPTLSEAVGEAAHALLAGQPIHF